jgi:hypothetical protein
MQSARVKKGGRSRLLESTAAASLEAMDRLATQYQMVLNNSPLAALYCVSN